jgi:hypothetical protein
VQFVVFCSALIVVISRIEGLFEDYLALREEAPTFSLQNDGTLVQYGVFKGTEMVNSYSILSK